MVVFNLIEATAIAFAERPASELVDEAIAVMVDMCAAAFEART